MPREPWANAELRDLIASVETGTSVRSQSRPKQSGEVGVLKTSAVTYGVFRPDEHKAVLPEEMDRVKAPVRGGTVLVSRMNTVALAGASAFVADDHPELFLPDRIWALHPRASVDPRWIHAYLASPAVRERISELATGTSGSMKNIARDRFLSLQVRVPPLPEQRKIAAILSSVDEVIEKTEAVIEQLRVVRKSMMQELLTRGIPGRHTRFKQTEIGEIPEGWEVVEIGAVAKVGNGSTPSKKRLDYWEGGSIPWLPTGKVNEGVIRSADSFVTPRALNECPIRLLPVGTILMAMIGQGKTRGKVAYLAVEATINQNFAYIMPSSRVEPWFLFLVLDHQYQALRSSGRGSNQDALNCGIIRRFMIPLPSRDEQAQIAEALQRVADRLEREEETAAVVRDLKLALMSVLLTGEIRVTPDEQAA